MDTYVEPKIRTVKLRAALAVGAAAVAGAFGVGYRPRPGTRRNHSGDRRLLPAAVHTSSDATAESLCVKQRSPLRGARIDIRLRRVE